MALPLPASIPMTGLRKSLAIVLLLWVALIVVQAESTALAQDISWCTPSLLSSEGEVEGALPYGGLIATTDSFGNMHLFWRQLADIDVIMYARFDQAGIDLVRDILPSDREAPAGAFVDDEGYIRLTTTVADSYFVQRKVHILHAHDARNWLEADAQPVPGAVSALEDGTWYALRRTIDRAFISYSIDQGGTWSREALLAASGEVGVLLRSSVHFDSSNRLHLVWTSSTFGSLLAGTELRYAHSDSFGETWSSPVVLVTRDESYTAEYGIGAPELSSDSLGRIFLIWNGAPAG